MCGINGFIQTRGEHSQKLNDIQQMNQALTHRGPDDHGQWSFQEKLYFGHRRLSILDLSELGHQPMTSKSGHSTLVLNGEIYNYKELAKQLSTTTKGHSDTEVLLEYLEEFGMEKTLENVRGMFAFAYFLEKSQTLTLARDPFGEKPLYYGNFNNGFYFSSELKAFSKLPGFRPEIDKESLGQYLNYNYVPSPRSIYTGINKLPAGHYLEIQLGENSAPPKAYFSKNKSEDSFFSTDDEVLSQVSVLLEQSIKRQMISDVPLGVFLSSGVDSSLIAALMQKLSNKPVQSFTIGFESQDYDESTNAGLIAEHLGLQHTEYVCTSRDLLEQVPKIASIYDEPFSDPSQVPTLLLSKMTRENVTVALSGDGGDEVFAGYNRYIWLKKAHTQLKYLPTSLYGVLKLLPIPYVANKIDKLTQISNAANLSEAYELSLQNNHASELYRDQQAQRTPATINGPEDMMLQDQNRYLPDDILVKVDRASMAHGLETRAPYLDRDLYSYVAKLPMKYKIRNGESKWPLRNLLKEHLPDKFTKLPKKGFAVPIDSWFRSELKDWMQDMLSEDRIKKQGYLNPKVVSQYVSEHMSKKKNRQYEIWNLLVFQSWLDKWR